MTERYEDIRDHSDIVPANVREKWLVADQKERMLRYQYGRVEEDADLTPEAKSRRATEIYERDREGVERHKREAREGLIRAAKSAEKNAVPRPSGEALSSTDPTKLLLDQNEAGRIVRTIERRKAQTGPFRPDTGDLLRQEYARGLEVGGVEGGAVCRGVLRAAQELGAGDEWLDALRNDRQRKSLDDARRLAYFSDLISEKAPEPPKSLRKPSRRAAGNGPTPLLVPASGGSPIPASGGSSRATKKRRKKAS